MLPLEIHRHSPQTTPKKSYSTLTYIFFATEPANEPLKERLLTNNWEEMQRFAASVKFGYIPASLLMTRVLAYTKRNMVTKAL
nr:hypothetical protein GTC16762_32010 [Pigmentibacter ruber]